MMIAEAGDYQLKKTLRNELENLAEEKSKLNAKIQEDNEQRK